MKTEEKYIHSLRYSDITRAISRDFFRVFCINTATNVFVEFIAHENDEELDIKRMGEDFRTVIKDLNETAFDSDIDTVSNALTKANILKVLELDDSFTLNYRMMIEGRPTYVRVKATRIKREDPSHILFGISNTDAHMQRLAMYERSMKKNLTYAAISEALASDYACIYYVNTLSGEFIEYRSSDLYKTLKLDRAGSDFFEYSRTRFLELIFEQDRDTYLEAFDKENLLKVLSVDKLFLLTFRVLFQGHPVYIRLKVTKMLEEDDHHIVVGITNVDASMQRIQKYEEMRAIANRDALTGVKSKHAYTVTEEQINREIEQKESEPFAVAVCDVNGLKQINDTLGHKAGDKYIKDACAIVCDVFKRSPVFRIGGDEFVVLMKNSDYENRDELLDVINKRAEENKEKGSVVIAVGISCFDAGEDKAVSDVFERADALMYERKAKLKGGEAVR